MVSVIVPIYKVEKYIHECIDSILSSIYTDLEIILVDDGSPDECPRICDEYAQKDSRIKVIHQENQGLCAARNAGLDIATGEYVAFVDSDDVVSPFLYEKLVEVIETENADWAACEYTRKQGDLLINSLPASVRIKVLEGMEALLSALTCAPSIRDITWTSAYVWDKLYRREAIAKPFPVGCMHSEDLQFNWDYLQDNNKLAIINSALYFYRVNEESITETYRHALDDRVMERACSLIQVDESIAEQVPDECEVLKNHMIARTVSAMNSALVRVSLKSIMKKHHDFGEHICKYIRKHWKSIWIEKETYAISTKLSVLLFTFAYPLWLIATKLIKV